MAQKIIIDTDPGQDDAVAILLALGAPELEVLGLTVVAGRDHGVGDRGVAHPDPDQAVFFMHRIGADLRGGRDAPPAGCPDALSRAVEGQSVIAAFHRVALDASLGQRQLAMRAGILQGDNLAFAVAEHANLFAKDKDLLEAVSDLVAPGRDIPGVLQKHGCTFM